MTDTRVCKFCEMPIAPGEERESAMGGYGHVRESRCMLALKKEIARRDQQLKESVDHEATYQRQIEGLHNIVGHAAALLETQHVEQALKVLRLQAEPADEVERLRAALVVAQRYLHEREFPIDHYVRSAVDEALGAPPLIERGAAEPVASRDADHCDYPDCEQHWKVLLMNCVDGWRKGENIVAPMHIAMRALADNPTLKSAPAPPLTTEDDFQHFLSYSGKRGQLNEGELRATYYAGADVAPPVKP